MYIQLVQANFIVGDIDGNIAKIIDLYNQACRNLQVDLVVFSENAVTGYPAEDLLLNRHFQEYAKLALKKLIAATINKQAALIVGSIDGNKNIAYVIENGAIIHTSIKKKLPNYDVFDEQRYFEPGSDPLVFQFKNKKIALLICEDMWFTENLEPTEIVIVINASPFHMEKDMLRKIIAKSICITHNAALFYVNQVGGQDELVFDGGSFALNNRGKSIAQLAYFKEDSQLVELAQSSIIVETLPNLELIYQALVLGLKDYVHKNGFSKVLLGISGGIDSALVAAIAVDALGKDNVMGVMLPSKYTSKASLTDADILAKQLSIELINLPIEGIADKTREVLFKQIDLVPASLADQNIQARTRGLVLMALSNQLEVLLLSTGNKSENAVGYATLYGDMCGGYNPLKDVYKTQVFELAKYRLLPESIINKAPSAELHFNQTDQDNLPDYLTLDKILYQIIEMDQRIIEGFDQKLVEHIYNLVKKSEYKRQQSCLGPIVSIRSLSKGRRYPVVNLY